MDSLFLDQLDPNEVPPRPPQKGAKLYYDSDGSLKVRKFGEIETLSSNSFPTDWTQIASNNDYVYSGSGETITVTQDKTNVTVTNVGSGNLVFTDTDRSKYVIAEPGDIVTFTALWDVGGTFNFTVTDRQYLATSGNPRAYVRTSTGGGSRLNVTISGDGNIFQPVSYNWPPTYTEYVRDASVIRYGSTWVVAYTNAFNGTLSFGVTTSSDLITWTKVGDITVPGVVGTPNNTWAPEWYVEDGRYYIIVRVSTEAGNVLGTPGMLWTECTNPGTWTTFTNAQSIGGIATDFNDVCLIKRGETYYLYAFNDDDIVVCKSSEKFTGYGAPTVISDSWRSQLSNSPVEGPNVIHIKGDHYRIYFQKAVDDTCYFADSYDGMQTWSSVATQMTGNLPASVGYQHGTVLPVDVSDVSDAILSSLGNVRSELKLDENLEQSRWYYRERDIQTTTLGVATATSGVGFSVSNTNTEFVGIRISAPATTLGYATVRNFIPIAQIFNGRGTFGDNTFTWNIPFKLNLDFDVENNYSSGITFRLYLGAQSTYTNEAITKKAVGFHLVNNQLTGVMHDGTTLTQTSATTISTYRRWFRLSIYSDGTTCTFFLNGTAIGTTLLPPTVTGWPDMGFTCVLENDGTGDAQGIIPTRAGYGFLLG